MLFVGFAYFAVSFIFSTGEHFSWAFEYIFLYSASFQQKFPFVLPYSLLVSSFSLCFSNLIEICIIWSLWACGWSSSRWLWWELSLEKTCRNQPYNWIQLLPHEKLLSHAQSLRKLLKTNWVKEETELKETTQSTRTKISIVPLLFLCSRTSVRTPASRKRKKDHNINNWQRSSVITTFKNCQKGMFVKSCCVAAVPTRRKAKGSPCGVDLQQFGLNLF